MEPRSHTHLREDGNVRWGIQISGTRATPLIEPRHRSEFLTSGSSSNAAGLAFAPAPGYWCTPNATTLYNEH